MRGFAVVAAAALVAGCGIGADVPVAKTEAVKFHRQFNAGQFAAIYRNAGKDLTGVISEADWIRLCEQIEAMLGKFKEGSQTGWFDKWNNGVHEIDLTFVSVFERGAAEEQVVYRKADDRYLLAGYHVTPKELPPPVVHGNAVRMENSSE